MKFHNIAVLGAGAWGTALAIHLARVGHQVRLWDHNVERAVQMQAFRENQRYLKGIAFPDKLAVCSDLALVTASADAILLVIPSHVFRGILKQLKQTDIFQHQHLAWATKGFEPNGHAMLHQVVADELGEDVAVAALSGPTFADEVARGLPTAMVSASAKEAEAQFWADAFHHDQFRMYTQTDVVGVEVGGAYKNIMAIATGLSDGMKLGANARAALIARGMVEMMRLGNALGACQETLMGLAGLGDLVLTCTDDLSRNRRFGLLLAQPNKTADEVMEEIGQVVEGVKAVKAVKALADQHGLDLPIMTQVNRILSGEITAKEAVHILMTRDGRAEAEL